VSERRSVESNFTQIIQDHQRRLLSYATRFLGGDTHQAADVVQEVFLRLWNAREVYVDTGKLESYLLRTTHHLCLDTLRRPQYRKTQGQEGAWWERVATGDATPEEQVQKKLRAGAICEAIFSLPEAQRAVLVLSTYEGLSYEEIAHVLEISAGTVASRKHQAIAKLRGLLKDWK
jgi:RNA polymerase sigma-70 factor, ECF subfamily